MRVTADESDTDVNCDSQVRARCNQNHQIRIRKYDYPMRLLYPMEHSFYESCRSKLDWASRLGGK
jgi:NAD+ kinase